MLLHASSSMKYVRSAREWLSSMALSWQPSKRVFRLHGREICLLSFAYSLEQLDYSRFLINAEICTFEKTVKFFSTTGGVRKQMRSTHVCYALGYPVMDIATSYPKRHLFSTLTGGNKSFLVPADGMSKDNTGTSSRQVRLHAL